MLNIKKEENKNNATSIKVDVEKKEIKNDNNSNNFL